MTMAQTQFVPNYDESKIPPYTLPDVLQLPDGKRLTNSKQWETQQRPRILSLYKEHVYGQLPGRPAGMRFVVQSVDEQALGGKAIRKQVAVMFGPNADSPRMDLLLYLPKGARGAVPVFAGLNFFGNHCVHTDPGINLSTRWMMSTNDGKIVNHRATEAARGKQASRWQVEEVLSRGYGVATVYYGDLEPDHAEGWKDGIRTSLRSVTGLAPEAWSAIGAWAWGISRMMDYLETDQAVDAKRVILHGHSRLGKAAIWAAVNDSRFAALIANESGEGGAALARREYGETIERINTSFPHWFVPKFKTYNGKANELPVDQHMLLALVAPRPLYVASAEGDQWADPKGEFLGAYHAGAVWNLYKRPGLGVSEMPAVEQPVGKAVRYHIRRGEHDIKPYDWAQYLNFGDAEVRLVQ